MAIAEREKAKSRAAIEHAEAAQRIAELEAQKRINAEMKAIKEAEEKKKVLDSLAQTDVRYRKYTIEEIESATEFFSESRKIGEGGYGPVYKCNLDHTQVAIKVLRPDAAQGRSQFQQEVCDFGNTFIYLIKLSFIHWFFVHVSELKRKQISNYVTPPLIPSYEFDSEQKTELLTKTVSELARLYICFFLLAG